MPRSFVDQNNNYYETLTDIEVPDGHTAVPLRPGPHYTWNGNQWVSSPPPPPTSAELDTKAAELAERVLEQNTDAMRAMGETLAEVIYRVSNGSVPQNITAQQARTWVRDTFREKYRALLD